MTQGAKELVTGRRWGVLGRLGRLDARDALDQSYSRVISVVWRVSQFPSTYHSELINEALMVESEEIAQ